MEAKELRIGGWVSYLVDGKLVFDRVKSIYYDDEEQLYRCEFYSGRYKLYHTSVKAFKAIPLTEELLLKCGFDYQMREACFDKSNIRLRLYAHTRCSVFIGANIAFGRQWIDVNMEIKHFHQLQNLYFALTGKELEVNL